MRRRQIFHGAHEPKVYLSLIALFLLALLVRVPIVEVYEDVAYHIDPSAQRAFAYGERHFNAARSSEYDIGRADHFFTLAAAKDPTILYLYHERARISFLRGDFKTALAQINFQISMHGDTTLNSYYIRGLIEGYMGKYAESAQDYEHFLQSSPQNWAAINDYAWVLLKAGRSQDAAVVTTEGIALFPDNPWLLNSQAIALYEMNAFSAAFDSVKKASAAVSKITEAQWLHAYPGNDPKIAREGIDTFKQSVADNMHMIALAAATSTVQ